MILSGCVEDRTYYHVGEEFIKEAKKFNKKNHLNCGEMFINPLYDGVVIYIYSFCENSVPFVSNEAYLMHKKYHIYVHVKIYRISKEEELEMFFRPKPDIEFIFK